MIADLHTDFPKSHFLATKEQSRELDEKTIRDFGLQGSILMEIAGEKAASFIAGKQEAGKLQQGIFYCGKGNNSGDALVAARYLAEQHKHHITIALCADEKELSKDAGHNLELLKKLSEQSKNIQIVQYNNQAATTSYDYQVDGLIGTGLSSDLREPLKSFVQEINQISTPLYALDIPTGLDGNTGNIHGSALKASYTVTFGTHKLGFHLNHGPDLTGEIKFVELPFPSYLHPKNTVLLDEELAPYLPNINRKSADHKYKQGTVHIVAGSEGLTGAAILAAKSAWNSGAGAVILYAPKKLLSIYEIALPEIIKVPVGDDDDHFFKPSHVNRVLKSLQDKEGVLLIGPGMGSDEKTTDFTADLLKQYDEKAVIDADALSAWKTICKFPTSKLENWTLTPHPGELKKYIGCNFSDDHERLTESRSIVEKYGVNLLSKGHPSIYIGTNQETYITGYNTRAFSRAGKGDILAGATTTNLAVTNSITLSTIRALLDGNIERNNKCKSTYNPFQSRTTYD